MSVFEEFLKKHCPDGVEYKQIKDIAKINRGIIISKKYIEENKGDYPVYSSQTENNGELGRINNYAYDGEYLTWTTDGANAGSVFYRNEKFNITNVCGLIKITESNVITKFVYYILRIYAPKYVNRGMGNCKLMSNVMESIKIPIPPIEVQKEIVRILDTFTKYQDLLNRELELRKKQYEYYRDKLLTFTEGTQSCGDEVEWKCLGELLQPKGYIRGPFGSALKKDFFVKDGVPVYEQQHAIYNKRVFRYFVDCERADKLKRFTVKPYDIIISCSGTIGKISIIMPEDRIGIINQALLILRLDLSKVNVKYIKHYLECFPNLIVTSSGGAITNIEKREIIEKIKIPVPQLEEQERIVKILDQFDTLCNDITRGLPAEIELRKKQYEYYRDKLLTFKEKKK
ncbi:restriction endonuclease subunit S [Brachyspira pilosicoli]|uniref:restriction endonuclease subunit S n=1 Tax=Brachyspira pilosicoli TaxID=52584 RepID=UPI000C778987|nr:restriction endonuclease subunit S [Brachyspira pilosicoli]PLV62052.1 type I restriction endonuclease subunit S [Brachyspira pilosicoli SP16]